MKNPYFPVILAFLAVSFPVQASSVCDALIYDPTVSGTWEISIFPAKSHKSGKKDLFAMTIINDQAFPFEVGHVVLTVRTKGRLTLTHKDLELHVLEKYDANASLQATEGLSAHTEGITTVPNAEWRVSFGALNTRVTIPINKSRTFLLQGVIPELTHDGEVTVKIRNFLWRPIFPEECTTKYNDWQNT